MKKEPSASEPEVSPLPSDKKEEKKISRPLTGASQSKFKRKTVKRMFKQVPEIKKKKLCKAAPSKDEPSKKDNSNVKEDVKDDIVKEENVKELGLKGNEL